MASEEFGSVKVTKNSESESYYVYFGNERQLIGIFNDNLAELGKGRFAGISWLDTSIETVGGSLIYSDNTWEMVGKIVDDYIRRYVEAHQ